MSLRRPASGRRVGAGTLRVDAARAIAKLRDYQLSEPTAWILEGIRAAVASGATSVDLQGDSNDVWLSWKGAPWASDTLPALLDELVSPASARQGQELRLLGTAVNSALGLRPAYIDVYRIADGKAEKVRYLAELLEEQEDDASDLTRPALEAVEVPKQAGDASMFIHFRRRFGLEPLRNLIQGQPPEMRIARKACGDLPVPIMIGKDELGAHCNQSDLLRVEIGNDIDGFLALMDPKHAHPSGHALMHIAEQGVHIASYALDLENSDLHASPPIRFFIDAERMPTNASRSEVRRNAHPIATAEKQLPKLFAALCSQIVSELQEGAETEATRRSQLRGATLSLLGAFIAGQGWSGRARNLRKPFQQLTKLKLVHNALGDARALGGVWDESTLYEGKEPLLADMALWFSTVLWLKEGDSAALIQPHRVDSSIVRIRLRDARKQLKARRRFESHARREARFDRVPSYWVRAPLDADVPKSCVSLTKQAFDGEIYLWPRGRRGTLAVLIEGREIEEVTVAFSPIPFRAVISAPKLSPEWDYRSVRRDRHFLAVQTYVQLAAVRCVEALCLDGVEPFERKIATSAAELRELVQGAFESLHELGIAVDSESPLAQYAAFELTSGGWACLADLRKQKAVGAVTQLSHSKFAPPKRVTLVIEPRMLDCHRALLEPGTAFVLYDARILDQYDISAKGLARALLHREPGVVALAVIDDECWGAIAWGFPNGKLRISHQAHPLTVYKESPSAKGTTILVHGDHVIPGIAWAGLRDDAGLKKRDYSSWHTKLVRAFALALIGRPPKEFLSNTLKLHLQRGAGLSFVKALLAAMDVKELLGETYDALRAAPIFDVLGGGLASADDLAAAFPTTLDYLETAKSDLAYEDNWRPLIAHQIVAKAVSKLISRGFRDGTVELNRRRRQRLSQAKLHEHRKRPRLDPLSLVNDAPSVVEFKSNFAKGFIGIGPGTSPSHLDLHLLVEGRFFWRSKQRTDLPIVGAIDIDPSRVNAKFDSVLPSFLGTLTLEILACAPRLLEAKLQAESAALTSDWTVLRFCGLWLQEGNAEKSDVEKIRNLARFSDQRGRPLAIGDACDDAFLRISTFDAQPWLEASNEGTIDELDSPILTTTEDTSVALTPILRSLCDEIMIRDVSDEMRKLQIRRRIEQGLLVSPSVPVDATLKRSLTDLIPTEMIGEIGFHDRSWSQVRLCEMGTEKLRKELHCLPAVVIAVEDPELVEATKPLRYSTAVSSSSASLDQRVRALTHKLVQSVLESGVELPEWLHLQLVRGLCLRHIHANEIPGLAERELFTTTQGKKVSWQILEGQSALYNSVWHTEAGDVREPLDPLRIAITLPPEARKVFSDELLSLNAITSSPEARKIFSNGLPFVDAIDELAMDEVARSNRAKPPLAKIAFSDEQSMAAFTTLTFSDKEGTRGIVAPLHPRSAIYRKVLAHREMRSIGTGLDPCSWPTLAIVDDPQLSPDRSWTSPLQDEQWALVSESIIKASDHALIKAIPPPDGMLTSHWVGRSVESSDPDYLTRGISIRGRLWLSGTTEAGTIRIQESDLERLHHPSMVLRPGKRFSLPIHGELLCHPPLGQRLAPVMQELIEIVYPRLMRQAAALKRADPDIQAAHLAIGLATKHTTPEAARKAKKVKFSCFTPAALDAEEILKLTQSDKPVAMIDKDDMWTTPESVVFVRDDSELSRALERLFAGRLFDTATPAVDSVDIKIDISDLEVPTHTLAPKPEIHALDSLADDLHRRLAQLDLNTVYDSVLIMPRRTNPAMAFEHGRLVLAGKSHLLRSFQAQRISGNSTHESCLDLLVAHSITLLNLGLTSVTDSAERQALVTLLRLEH